MIKTPAAAILVLLFAGSSFAETNPVFEEVTSKGIALPKGPAIRLPAPTMADGLDSAAQRKALETVADERRPVAALLKNSVTAPIIIKSGDDKASVAAGGTGRRVDIWFVVYGDLQKIASEGFWQKDEDEEADEEEAVNPNDAQFSGKLLTPEELTKRRIKPLLGAGIDENYGTAEVQLFNRVKVKGTSRSIQMKTDESVIYASILDPRFATDAEFPNQWQTVSRDDSGKFTYGPWKPYAGMGSYAKATTLKEPKGAILVEYHMAFDEPAGWFNGANVIRSKLPVVVQDNVKKLRRKLAEKQ